MDGVQREVVHCIGAGIVHSTSFGFGPSRSFFSSVLWPSYHFWLGLTLKPCAPSRGTDTTGVRKGIGMGRGFGKGVHVTAALPRW
jgi:hypothetical protein